MSAVLGIVQFQRLGTETGQTLPAGRTADTVQSDAAGVKFRLQFERNLIPEVFLRIILRGKPGRTHGALLVKTGTLSSVSYELRAHVLSRQEDTHRKDARDEVHCAGASQAAQPSFPRGSWRGSRHTGTGRRGGGVRAAHVHLLLGPLAAILQPIEDRRRGHHVPVLGLFRGLERGEELDVRGALRELRRVVVRHVHRHVVEYVAVPAELTVVRFACSPNPRRIHAYPDTAVIYADSFRYDLESK